MYLENEGKSPVQNLKSHRVGAALVSDYIRQTTQQIKLSSAILSILDAQGSDSQTVTNKMEDKGREYGMHETGTISDRYQSENFLKC